jgi:hypothetical protein
MKSLNGFRVGCDFQVAYPVRGNTNILQNRLYGKIIRVGKGKNGEYVLAKYICHKTDSARLATFSLAKMVNPVVSI